MKRLQLKYIIPFLMDQMPFKRLIRNFFITGNAWGGLTIYAHYTKKMTEKVGYNTKESAVKAAESMNKKYHYHYSTYFCPRCGKFHVGKNRNSVKEFNEK